MSSLWAHASLRLVVPLAASFLLVPGELKLKEADHKNLSRLVSAHYDAKEEKKDINKSLQAVLDQIEAANKRFKGQNVLSFVSDWEQVFRLVCEGRLKETLKKRGEIEEKKVKSDNGLEVSFAYCVPKKPAKGALPLILAVCDSGEASTANLNANWNDPTVREAAILMAVQMPADTKSWGVFGSPDSPGGVFTVMTAWAIISREFSVDKNRTYLVGSGKGFAAAEATAATYPHVFAGVIGIGDVASSDPEDLGNFRTTPTLLIKGGEGASAIEAKLNKAEGLGFGNCTLDAEGGATKTWEWMKQNPRVAYPAQISFSPRSDQARTAHWISLSGVNREEHPHVEAKADRATNTITVDAQKVSDVVIYLNDELADLDKTVKFVINGKTHEQSVERNAPEMIISQYNQKDWGRVFTAAVSQDVRTK